MRNKLLFTVLVLWASTVLYSCKKEETQVCRNPIQSDLQGVWKQDYYLDPLAFQPLPEWSKIEFRNDSFYMSIIVRAELRTELDCYQTKWTEYAKGVFALQNDRLNFSGILTDSTYLVKTSGCHASGPYNARFGIKYCSSSFTMNILSKDTIVVGQKYEIKMVKTGE
ncbi:MAG: hypothetical protein ABI378_09560 [Chitinophagaceae bacterium]